ncbi:MAG TPA: beta-ketoacyl synthase N-terminal-like domain-containing protein [Phenylobacterium sp.]|jgi:malonyl-ACP decarboxylase|uniref:beta-ketoacyl synthase N-terminal-like domain-containing protein n=1 Tax=Phenylobacterium sp. TaxID=1871053 RepID=UPI002D718118|nr:beta-ketoacyl synthase N-terminal-like domain-containing protein [Phenylobacterium sp.]HZZ67810.1 beta-ketoacyl synthase N-terminal-like domain-containing protein [Phenylobacterium sp.]
MARTSHADMVITGLGVTSAIGQGVAAFSEALFAGEACIGLLRRDGRQVPDGSSQFIGAELDPIAWPAEVPARRTHGLSLSAQAAVATLYEAWSQARLGDVDPTRVGLVVGGSNLQQRELLRQMSRAAFISPSYGFSHFDSDLLGVCTETFGIYGPAFTVGAASASGQMALIQAAGLVASGAADVCVVIGALADLSHFECQALQSLGAMVSADGAVAPGAACRPFDRDASGFVYGEACAAVVLEQAEVAARRGVRPLAHLTGWAAASDANRNPNPTCEGEVRAIQGALSRAGLDPRQVDYVNPHGSGSPLGDRVEVDALTATGLAGAKINATKSIIGHGLAAAGLVEVVATLLQMEAGRLHPTLNLETPISDAVNWITRGERTHVRTAVNLSYGFGGLNTAVCLEHAS